MQNRQCGTCIACCEGWLHVEKLGMRPGVPCMHCTANGCKIYSDRPEDPCRKFLCAWMEEDSDLPENLKPSLSGVIVLTDRNWRDWKVLRAIPTGESIPPDSLEQLRLIAQKFEKPLLFYERILEDGEFVGVNQLAYGSTSFAKDVERYGGGESRFSIDDEDLFSM